MFRNTDEAFPGFAPQYRTVVQAGRQSYPIEPDYFVFKIPDEFVVGYGLDYQDLYRNLPFVGVLEPAISKHIVSMMRRLLVVARHFWPRSDESCHRLIHWLSCVATARNRADRRYRSMAYFMPAESDCREIRIVRLLPAPKGAWNETLFLRNVAAWIAKHRESFDAIYVDESRALLHQVASKQVPAHSP